MNAQEAIQGALAGKKTEIIAFGLIGYVVVCTIMKVQPDERIVSGILGLIAMTLGARIKRASNGAA